MRDHDDRPATHGRRERLDKRRFVFRVSKRRRLIEHQDGAILQKRPGDSNALPLAAGERMRVAVGKARRLKANVRQQIAGILTFMKPEQLKLRDIKF